MKFNKIWIAVALSWCWWIYLGLTSQMLVSGDALGYHYLADMLNQQGWGEYFTTGPNREPGYPLLVATSLKLGQWTGMDHLAILKAIQLALLGCAQLMVWRWLLLLGVSSTGIMLAVAYIGFSPALLNAALSMYSEILIIPLWIALILAHTCWWQAIMDKKRWLPALMPLWIAVIWLACIAIKAIAWYVFLMYWAVMAAVLVWKLPKGTHKRVLGGWVLMAAIVVGSIQSYTQLQFLYNGSRMLTDRGTYLFYANAIRRTAVLDRQKVLAAVTAVPGEGLCYALMRQEDCLYWGINNQDVIGFAQLAALQSQGYKGKQKDDRMFKMGFEAIKTNPPQYAFFTFLEACKIFFWESTQVSFVLYPPWLKELYVNGMVKNAFRLVPAMAGIWAFIVLVLRLWKLRRAPWGIQELSALVLLLVIVFVAGMYALATLVVRYAFMLGPLWVGLWALAAQRRRIFK